MRIRPMLAAVPAIAALVALVSPNAHALATHTYRAPATVVARAEAVPPPYTTVLDAGGVVCRPLMSEGIGGACIPWTSGGNGIHVPNEAATGRVAYQVCIDNNGDGICTAGFDPLNTACRDFVAFSHGDGEQWINPLGPLPTNFKTGCTSSAGFKGWVVLICAGTHVPKQTNDAHPHAASNGTVSSVNVIGQFITGNYCGGDLERIPPIHKPYVVL